MESDWAVCVSRILLCLHEISCCVFETLGNATNPPRCCWVKHEKTCLKSCRKHLGKRFVIQFGKNSYAYYCHYFPLSITIFCPSPSSSLLHKCLCVGVNVLVRKSLFHIHKTGGGGPDHTVASCIVLHCSLCIDKYGSCTLLANIWTKHTALDELSETVPAMPHCH